MPPCRLASTNLACRRGEQVLFAGLSLALTPGEALQVTGANGIGKSSLIRILAGLARPFAGTVERSGGIGLVDEHPALDPNAPLGQALAFWARLDRANQEETREIQARLGLADLLDVPMRYLSTGQRKRAALARLLAQGADIWLLDEPLNGLDSAGVALVEALVAQHCAGGGITIAASHQPIALPGSRQLALADYVPELGAA